MSAKTTPGPNESFNEATLSLHQLLNQLHAANSEACAANNQLLHLHLLDLIASTHMIVVRMRHIAAILNEERDHG